MPMFGCSEIRELSADDVPVAVTATIMCGQPETELRFYEGRFYRQSKAATFEPGSYGLEGEMARAICEHLIAERMSAAAIGPGDDKIGWRQPLWLMHKDARRSLAMKSRTLSVPDALWAITKPFDPSRHSDELLSTWADVAANYMSSLVLVDGRLWVPADEPMFAITENSALYDDASCYRAKNDRPSKLPSPFGTDKGALGDVCDYHPYWDPRYSFVTLLEAVEDRNIPINGPCDVLMPEAFTLDHASLQLDRAARVAAASINWLTDEVTLVKGSDWMYFLSAFKRFLRPGSPSTLDDLEHLLGEFSDHLARRAVELDGGYFLRETRLQEMIESARSRWNDRPVELGSDLGIQPRGPKR